MKRLAQWLGRRIVDWLTKDGPPSDSPLCDFNRLSFELRPGDVVLVEGRTRVAEVISLITRSPWTHSALYVGRLYDIRDPELRVEAARYLCGRPDEQLLLEALLGHGTILSPLRHYRHDHLRICRPCGLSPQDTLRVIEFALRHVGDEYDTRQMLDLARFLFPWAILPRRWRSSLFQHNAGTPTHTVCSSLLAEAFSSVNFPVLPFIDRRDDGSVRFFKRNPRLFAPRDFDYSPYFRVIKYPYLGLNDLGLYQQLPWADDSLLYNDDKDFAARAAALPALKHEGAQT
jgi:hypothetical protein